MKFGEFITTQGIIFELKAVEKKEAIKEIVEKIVDVHDLADLKAPKILEILMKREKIGSTGIGNGIAVPHAKLDGLDKVVGGFARSVAGVDFNAVDGMPVNLIFLILAPSDKPELNLQTLQHISRAIKQPNFCKFLKNARDTKAIVEVFNEADELLK